MADKYRSRLRQVYLDDVRPEMKERFSFANDHQIPKPVKVVVNMGLGKEAMDNANNITNAVNQMEMITGQKCVVSKAKRSVAGFRLREGHQVEADHG